MGRARKNPKDHWMPARVYRGKSAYEWHPPAGGAIRLAPLAARPAVVIRRYDEEVARANQTKGSVAALLEEFFDSLEFKSLASGTQRQYQKNSKTIIAVFGKMTASAVKTQQVRQFMDKRGESAQTTANRELALFSRVYSWAYERGKVPLNPCKGVRRFTEKPRDRYITDDEYYAVLAQAPDRLRAIIEIAYCCAARISDVLKLQREDIREEGIYIKQGKTGKEQIKAWTPRLRSAYEVAKGIGLQSTTHVLTTSKGGPIAYNTFRKWWTTAKTKAEDANPDIAFDFTFHDIKAKSISDWEGDKQKFSGHKTQGQVAVYDRKVPIVGAHE